MNAVETHLCRGPDGGQLLGFLCSLGLLEAATRSLPSHRVRLGFGWHEVGFRPLLSVEPAVDRETLVARLHDWIGRRARSPELNRLGDSLPCDAAEFTALARELLEGEDPRALALLAAFGFAQPDSGQFADTEFRAVGTGQQRFLKVARSIAEQTTTDHVARCLFERWKYEDPGKGLSLRFDPTDDRRYALRADDPATSSSAPIRTVHAANALAFEGLALVPVVPPSDGSKTTLFSREGRVTSIRWPVWERFLSRDAVASLLAATEPTGHGIAAIFRAKRLTGSGPFGYRSFTPAERIA